MDMAIGDTWPRVAPFYYVIMFTATNVDVTCTWFN